MEKSKITLTVLAVLVITVIMYYSNHFMYKYMHVYSIYF